MLKRLSPSSCIPVLAALLLLPLLVSTANARQMDRVTEAVDTRQGHALKGHLPRWVSADDDLGALAQDVQLDHLTVVLARSASAQAAFEQLLEDQQNTSSPRYHQWLTPQQVGTQFGLTDHDLEAVTGWLSSQGLRVDAISPDRTRITFSGASSKVAHAVGSEFHRYNVYVGATAEQRISVDSEPVIPAALAGVISGFHGLSEEHLRPQSHISPTLGTLPGSGSSTTPQFTSPSTGAHYVTPGDFATMFDITSVYNAGVNGAGVKIAIIGQSQVLAADITAFKSITANTTSTLNTIIPPTGTNPGLSTTHKDQNEQTLDVERVMGTAPGAQVDLVVSGDTVIGGKTQYGLDIAMQYEVNTLVDPIMTISYGSCEYGDPSDAAFYNSLFSTAASEGISTLVASGDSGTASCATSGAAYSSTTAYRSINVLCSSPYVTCVGGTQPIDTTSPATYWSTTNSSVDASALSYIPEGAWNEPTTTSGYQVLGTGGGPSLYIAKPSWQTGTGVPTDLFRDTPDVSFPSSSHDSYLICFQNSCASGSFYPFSGTSAAAPGMAGIMALVVQKLGAHQGNFNPTLYRLAASTTNVFHDATPASSGVSSCSVSVASLCNNSTPSATALTGGVTGYALTTGYDLATGWGSIDVTNLIASASTGFYITSTSSPNIAAGTSGTTSITITSHDGFTGTVVLTCAITSSPSTAANITPTCAIAPASITLTSGSSATSTITLGTTVRNAISTPTAAGFAHFGAFPLLLLLAVPLALRKCLPSLLFLALLTIGLGTMTGCGGGGSSTKANGTIAGQYTATVTGTSGATTATGTVTFTVN